jgi:hypothetical protein
LIPPAPNSYPKLYGPKIRACPGQLSVGEYGMLGQILPIVIIGERSSEDDEEMPEAVADELKGWSQFRQVVEEVCMILEQKGWFVSEWSDLLS